MHLRIIAAASLAALIAQGCYRPMYNQPYGYSSPGYPMGGGYPGSIQTIPQGQPYVPGSTMPMGTQPGTGGLPTYGAPGGTPTYSPNTFPPSATNPVPNYNDAAQFQQPDTAGGRELGYSPGSGGVYQTAGSAPAISQPNAFAPNNPAPIAAEPTYAEPAPATVTSDNFEGGNGPNAFY